MLIYINWHIHHFKKLNHQKCGQITYTVVTINIFHQNDTEIFFFYI